MSIFNHSDYRTYLKDWLNSKQHKGRGQLTKIAAALNIHSTLLSLILSGERELTLEHGFALTRFLELNEAESDYFMLLLQYVRAGHHEYRKNLKSKIEKAQQDAQNLSKRFSHETRLGPEERAIFYSTWLYSAIRLFCSTDDKGKTVEEVTTRFNLKRAKVMTMLDWLASTGLLLKENDKYLFGTQRTYLERGSPLLEKHHSNWRLRALNQFDSLSEEEMMFTSPMSISKKDFVKLREMLAEFIEKSSPIIKESPAEEVACLNIDFFWVK